MDKKTVIQLFLSSVIIVIFLVIFYKYFNQETSTKKIDNIEKEISKSLNEKSNLIKGIEYFSKDETGSIYNISAESGEINDNNPDIIFLTNVKAKISTLNSEDIFIESNFAKYNSKNYDTNFYENIKVNYAENKIDCEYLDLLFNRNQAILYENIVYKNLETRLLADRLEIDLITKNSKLSMKSEKEKIKIVYMK
jgi:hypothetical protein|tara:strand:+ start:666 stop:1250 length:585 start_codon:yes stop_codon:yes gene_type:complete